MNQTASRVILIRPSGFGYDDQTAASNAFQHRTLDPDVRARALNEFDGLIQLLDQCGIGTTVLDPVKPEAPNAVFPNNWFSTHADGTLVLYPMCTPSRRVERDPSFQATLRREGADVSHTVDLSSLETEGRFLEGTGSLVLDRIHRRAYAAVSPRTSEGALNRWCARMGYDQVPFLATMDGTLTGQPIYHTNVVLSIGEAFAAVCLDALPYPVDREDVQLELERGGKELVPLNLDQMMRFAGNMLQLRSVKGAFIFLSATAFASLRAEQRTTLERHGQLVPVDVPTIETVGGGSVRCMLAEDFLPRI